MIFTTFLYGGTGAKKLIPYRRTDIEVVQTSVNATSNNGHTKINRSSAKIEIELSVLQIETEK